MKKVIISTILSASFLFATAAQANVMALATESNLVEVCEAIKSDSVIKVNVAVRDSGFGMKQIANGLVCNGADPVNFALANDAEKTAKYLAAKSNTHDQELVASL